MAAKRLFDETEPDPDQHSEKRRRSRPSLASAIEEVMKMNFVRSFCSTLEPILRRVVNEEVQNGLRRSVLPFSMSPSLRIQALEPSNLQLKFAKRLSSPIFTGSKVVDTDGNPLELILVDTKYSPMSPTSTVPYPLKIEMVVLDGDFPEGDLDTWAIEEFGKNIVKEREGKRPLLTGEVNLTMRDGLVGVGDIEFTDNSSWIRSRRFRIGARVVGGASHGIEVREAMTEPFVVKDHRGELYKKHHPPMLEDEVWRLEKIGKEGAFHKKLASEGIHTVQDFLKLSIVDQSKLRQILGAGMSEKMWEITLRHARTCFLGSKIYVSRGSNHMVALNPICQVVKAMINGQTLNSRDLSTATKGYIKTLVQDAYLNWNSLEEVEGFPSNTPLTQDNSMDHHPTLPSSSTTPYPDTPFHSVESMELGYMSKYERIEAAGSTQLYLPVEAGNLHYFSETSSDGDLPGPRSFQY